MPKRIWPRWKVDPVTGCWNWLLYKSKKGYAKETVKEGDKFVRRLAHKQAWIKKYGAVPNKLELDHRCNNRGCVNPDHLEPKRKLDNMRRAGQVTLTEDDVRAIRVMRALGSTYKELGEEYGVRPDHIQDIMQGKYWKTVK